LQRKAIDLEEEKESFDPLSNSENEDLEKSTVFDSQSNQNIKLGDFKIISILN